MKITALVTAVFITITFTVYAQNNFSSRTKMLYQTIENTTDKALDKRLKDKFSVFSGNEKDYINAIVKVSDNFDESFFNREGIVKRSAAGNIISLTIPLNKLYLLAGRQGVEYVSADGKLKSLLDSAISETGALKVHTGINLPAGVTGKNVVVGIIDFGFDYTHPVFYHSSDSLRITRVWEQQEERRYPPEGYSYGEELKEKVEIINKRKSSLAEYESHGTHVAGIAAGSGYLSGGKYTGMAPGSEIVLVEVGFGESYLLDAINYIFRYAASVGKPAVINMSIGSHMGPHDGTSLIDQAFDQLQGAGKILVGAAGNEGSDRIHIVKASGTDSVRTIWKMIQSGMHNGFNTSELNAWGEAGLSFSAKFTVVDTLTKQVISVSNSVSTENDGYQEILLSLGNDTLAVVEASSESRSALNNRHNMYITARVKKNYHLAFTITGNGTVHVWDLGEQGFSNIGFPLLFNEGDNNYSVSEVGGTGKNIISVGAYTTKNSFTNLNGEEMQIPDWAPNGSPAHFTSRGPTVDGRSKPDITAPGNAVASSVSSFDVTFEESLFGQYLVDKSTNGDKEWKYAIFQGTSMASPMAAGIIALMLEVNPQLSAAEIKNIFKKTGRQDSFTGEIPSEGSNLWGYGKIDAYNSVIAALNPTDVEDGKNLPDGYALYNNYPNPFNPATNFEFRIPPRPAGRADFVLVTLKIYDILGNEIATLINEEKEPGVYNIRFNAAGLASGVYYYRLTSGNFSSTKKMLLLK